MSAERHVVRYHHDASDWGAVYKFAYRGAAGRGAFTFHVTVPGVVGACIGMLAAGLVDIEKVSVVAVAVSAMAVTYALFMWPRRQAAEDAYVRAALAGRYFGQEHVLTISDTEVDDVSPLGRTTLSWQAFVKVQRTAHHIFLLFDEHDGIWILVRDSPDPASADAFWAAAERWHAKARPGNALGFPVLPAAPQPAVDANPAESGDVP
jgi:hypothetical protein